ncbi:MAG: FAD-dependent oxidoreductase, partial [Clostridiales bacterium]|nr:FAD-dependent oxidoreductase [Clostridiales bacterium]
IISNSPEQSGLWKAKTLENYPGMPKVSGEKMLEVFRKQIADAQVQVVEGRALSALSMGNAFGVTVGQDYYDCRTIILATGIVQQTSFSGETEFLGRGVSYCATCDGMLYRDKKVAMIGLSEEAKAETEFLRSIGCEVEYFDKNSAKKYEIVGEQGVKALIADGVRFPVSGVFILRNTIAPSSFLAGIETDGGHITVDENMKTSIAGVYAAGDCIGRPYQIARAVGQGNTAALSACEYLDKQT